MNKVYVNLGCGSRYHLDWVNIDIVPSNPDIWQHDLSQGIPFNDNSCDVVYHTAVLEHIRKADAPNFMAECYRVLKPTGVIRVGVPDLEQICQMYLVKLEEAMAGNQASAADYEWLMLELLDQMVREDGGGKMLDYLRQEKLPNQPFVFERIGIEGEELVSRLRQHKPQKSSTRQATISWRKWVKTFPSQMKQKLLHILLKEEGMNALRIGRFRMAGEVHQWMYDRYSLQHLLLTSGFIDPQVQSAHTSQIFEWPSFCLDTTAEGRPIKPDLLFMEAIKPDA